MIAAPVQCDVDRIPKGSHSARVLPRTNPRNDSVPKPLPEETRRPSPSTVLGVLACGKHWIYYLLRLSTAPSRSVDTQANVAP
jgi:hypothetical protein